MAKVVVYGDDDDDDDDDDDVALSHSLVVCGERDATSSPCLDETAVSLFGGKRTSCVSQIVALVLMVNKGLVDQSGSRGWLLWG